MKSIVYATLHTTITRLAENVFEENGKDSESFILLAFWSALVLCNTLSTWTVPGHNLIVLIVQILTFLAYQKTEIFARWIDITTLLLLKSLPSVILQCLLLLLGRKVVLAIVLLPTVPTHLEMPSHALVSKPVALAPRRLKSLVLNPLGVVAPIASSFLDPILSYFLFSCRQKGGDVVASKDSLPRG
jgi:hypothetical protein